MQKQVPPKFYDEGDADGVGNANVALGDASEGEIAQVGAGLGAGFGVRVCVGVGVGVGVGNGGTVFSQ